MGRFDIALIAALLVVGAVLPAADDSPLGGRTTSPSGRFVIYSRDPARRTQLSKRAEAARATWSNRLGGEGNIPNPIIIQDLIGGPKPRGNPGAVTSVFEGDGSLLKVQTNIYDPSALRSRELDHEIYRALGLQWIYKDHSPKAGKPFLSPPAWLLEALAHDESMREEGIPDGVYAVLLRSERPPKLEEFLRAKPELMEATSLTLYRAQALALLKGLQGLPEGTAGFGRFLSSLTGEDGDLKPLLAAFPSLGNDAAQLGKIWTLAIARDSAGRGTQSLSVQETGRALKALLDVSAPLDPKKPELGNARGPSAFPLIARSEGGPFLMRQKSAALFALEFRAHPLIRPVIGEYRDITSLLAAKPRKNLDRRLEENGKILDLLLRRSGQTDDYMNWFEATQLDTVSENFLGITSPPAPEKRTDPISLHLDAIEQRGW